MNNSCHARQRHSHQLDWGMQTVQTHQAMMLHRVRQPAQTAHAMHVHANTSHYL